MKHEKILHTGYLFSRPSFLSGLGSVLNLAGNYFEYNYSKSSNETDRKALQSDWKSIGQDISFSIHRNSVKKLHKHG